MPDAVLQTSPPEPEVPAEPVPVPKDLRSELQADLYSEFTDKLKLALGLPNAVTAELLRLLDLKTLATSEIIAALALEDSLETEVSGE